jgi:hypothetical protein
MLVWLADRVGSPGLPPGLRLRRRVVVLPPGLRLCPRWPGGVLDGADPFLLHTYRLTCATSAVLRLAAVAGPTVLEVMPGACAVDHLPLLRVGMWGAPIARLLQLHSSPPPFIHAQTPGSLQYDLPKPVPAK